jgi:hypothetical protein
VPYNKDETIESAKSQIFFSWIDLDKVLKSVCYFMRYHVSILSALSLGSSSGVKAVDDCERICMEVQNLCPPSKGSWCNKETDTCQNLMMTADSDFCYITPTNPCRNATPVKCSETSAKLREKKLFDEADRLAREIPADRKPKLGLMYEWPKPEEFGNACVIC